ncbi:MAG: hypothetical protein ACOCR6_00215, partial [archaeon]
MAAVENDPSGLATTRDVRKTAKTSGPDDLVCDVEHSFAFSAGTASGLLESVLVTESLSKAVEFFALLGLPAGLLASVIVGAFTFRYTGSREANDRQALARKLGIFGITTVVAFGVGLLLVDGGVTAVLLGATILGAVAGAIIVYRERSGRRVNYPTLLSHWRGFVEGGASCFY